MTTPFHEHLRYEYNLSPNSIVLDAGGFEGAWSEEIVKRYGCIVHCLEPIPEFFEQCVKRLRPYPSAYVHNYGLSNKSEVEHFQLSNNSTGVYSTGKERASAMVHPLDVVMDKLGIDAIDLLKINIEGKEFDVLENAIATDVIGRVYDIQCQWHDCAPNALSRFLNLQGQLTKTHRLTRDSGWTWQNWRIKE